MGKFTFGWTRQYKNDNYEYLNMQNKKAYLTARNKFFRNGSADSHTQTYDFSEFAITSSPSFDSSHLNTAFELYFEDD